MFECRTNQSERPSHLPALLPMRFVSPPKMGNVRKEHPRLNARSGIGGWLLGGSTPTFVGGVGGLPNGSPLMCW